MKKKNVEAVKNPENPEASPPPAKTRKGKKEQKHTDDVRLPVLVEMSYSVSVIFLIFIGISMIIISFLTGASLLNLVIRTSVAILVMGSLLMLIFSQISSGVLQASLVEQEEANLAEHPKSGVSESVENTANQDVAEA